MWCRSARICQRSRWTQKSLWFKAENSHRSIDKCCRCVRYMHCCSCSYCVSTMVSHWNKLTKVPSELNNCNFEWQNRQIIIGFWAIVGFYSGHGYNLNLVITLNRIYCQMILSHPIFEDYCACILIFKLNCCNMETFWCYFCKIYFNKINVNNYN